MTGEDPQQGSGRARPAARAVVRVVFVLLAVLAGVFAIARDVDGFLASLDSVGLGGIALSLVACMVGLLCSAEAWRLNVSSIAGAMAVGPARRVFFLSQLGKYLPGSVWPVLAQIEAARRYRLSGSRMAVAAMFFLALHLLTGVLVVALVVPWSAPDLLRSYPWVLLLLPLTLAAFVPGVLSRGIDQVLRRLGRSSLPRRLGGRDVASPSLWLMATWCSYAISAVAIAAPIARGGADATLFFAATGGFALAWIVGVVVLPAPAGVGAREVVLVLALSPLLGVTGAASFAIVLRVVHTVADLTLAGFAYVRARTEG
jgi:glycosyltransferase 2 family protein